MLTRQPSTQTPTASCSPSSVPSSAALAALSRRATASLWCDWSIAAAEAGGAGGQRREGEAGGQRQEGRSLAMAMCPLHAALWEQTQPVSLRGVTAANSHGTGGTAPKIWQTWACRRLTLYLDEQRRGIGHHFTQLQVQQAPVVAQHFQHGVHLGVASCYQLLAVLDGHGGHVHAARQHRRRQDLDAAAQHV